MELSAVVRAATSAPAAAIDRPDLGTLKPGSLGDASIIAIEEGVFEYRDVLGEVLTGERKLAPRGLVVGGAWWHPREGTA